MSRPHVGYRITIELATGGPGKTIQVIGETPDCRRVEGWTDADVCAVAANALIWESAAMSTAASNHAHFDRVVKALNMPLNQVPY